MDEVLGTCIEEKINENRELGKRTVIDLGNMRPRSTVIKAKGKVCR